MPRPSRAAALPVFGGASRHPDQAVGFASSLAQATRIASTHTRDNALIRHHGFSLHVFQPTDFLAEHRNATQPYYVFSVGKTVETRTRRVRRAG